MSVGVSLLTLVTICAGNELHHALLYGFQVSHLLTQIQRLSGVVIYCIATNNVTIAGGAERMGNSVAGYGHVEAGRAVGNPL